MVGVSCKGRETKDRTSATDVYDYQPHSRRLRLYVVRGRAESGKTTPLCIAVLKKKKKEYSILTSWKAVLLIKKRNARTFCIVHKWEVFTRGDLNPVCVERVNSPTPSPLSW